jgi:hypothetical protein
MAGLLEKTLQAWAQTPSAPFPCGQDVWDYACLASHREPTRLPPHRTEAEKQVLLNNEGGLVRFSERLAKELGWYEVFVPRKGDVAVLEVKNMGQVCAIFTGTRWALRGNNKVVLLNIHAAAPWVIWRKP